MWLVGVVIRRYIDILIIIINFPHSTCIRSFFGSSIYIYDEDFSPLYDKCGARSARRLLIFPTPLVIGLFLAAASLLLCSFLNVFSVLFLLFFYNI